MNGYHLGDGIEDGDVDPGLVKPYLALLIHTTPLGDPGEQHTHTMNVGTVIIT